MNRDKIFKGCPLQDSPSKLVQLWYKSFLHLLLIHLLSSRLSLFLPPPSHPCLRFLRHFTLFLFAFVKSHNVLCHVLSQLTSPVTMCLCAGLSSFFLSSFLSISLCDWGVNLRSNSFHYQNIYIHTYADYNLLIYVYIYTQTIICADIYIYSQTIICAGSPLLWIRRVLFLLHVSSHIRPCYCYRTYKLA